MMRLVSLVGLAMMMTGCGASHYVGPSPEDQEAAFQLVWIDWLKMERESAPVVSWFSQGKCDKFEFNGATIDPGDGCVLGSLLYQKGTMDVWWHEGGIAGTDYAHLMSKYQLFLMTGTYDQNYDVRQINAKLRSLGL